MISQEIASNNAALKGILPQVSPEVAAMIRLVRRNLMEVADQVAEMEQSWIVPTAPQVVREEKE